MDHFFIFKNLINSNFEDNSRLEHHFSSGFNSDYYTYNNYNFFNFKNPIINKLYSWSLYLDSEYNFVRYTDSKCNNHFVSDIPFIPNIKTITEEELFYLSLIGWDLS